MFLRSIATTAVLASFPRRDTHWNGSKKVRLPAGTLASLVPHLDPRGGPDDPRLRELAHRAVEAAQQAGAIYADVRFTAERVQTLSLTRTHGVIDERGAVYAAVRVWGSGGWGLATSPECSADSVVRLAREAAEQAATPHWPTGAELALDAAPPVATGSWRTPLIRDPFDVSVDEKTDWLRDLHAAPERIGLSDVTLSAQLPCRRQEKVFAATTGAYLTQTLSWIGPVELTVTVTDPVTQAESEITTLVAPLQTGGYELVEGFRPDAQLEGWVAEALRTRRSIPVPLGRCPIVVDTCTAAALVRSTIGYATELDRVRGDDVNASGTSFLTPTVLGQSIASPIVTITGSRERPHGPAATGWDDEGVAAQTFPLVDRGVLVDFATSRAEAPALAAWYTARQWPVRSRGCAVANSAADLPLVRPPDLVMAPGAGNVHFEDLVAQVGHGVAVMRGDCALDKEQRAGQGAGTMFEIRRGQIGRYLGPTAAFLFRSTELWRNVMALGGATSTELHGFVSSKGQPEQTASHGVWAVPMVVQDVTVIDALTN